MAPPSKKNFLWPFLKFSGKTLSRISSCLCNSFEVSCKCFCDSDNCALIFCACCWCLLPIYAVQFSIYLIITSSVALTFAAIGLVLGICYALIGIWPAFIVTVAMTGITIIRIPFNIYYTFKVLYYSVCITRGLKSLLLILTIPILFLTTVFMLVSVLAITNTGGQVS